MTMIARTETETNASSLDASDCPSFLAEHAAVPVTRWRDMTREERRAQLQAARLDSQEYWGSLEVAADRAMARVGSGYAAFRAGCSPEIWNRHVEACLRFASEATGGDEGLAAFLDAVADLAERRAERRDGARSAEARRIARVSAEDRLAFALAAARGGSVDSEDGEPSEDMLTLALREAR